MSEQEKLSKAITTIMENSGSLELEPENFLDLFTLIRNTKLTEPEIERVTNDTVIMNR